MEELFLQIYIPAFSKSYDIKATKNLKIHEVRDMLFELLSADIDSSILNKSKAVLSDKESGVIFNINKSVGELKIRNGSSLMLI
jgi:hypothetical protein